MDPLATFAILVSLLAAAFGLIWTVAKMCSAVGRWYKKRVEWRLNVDLGMRKIGRIENYLTNHVNTQLKNINTRLTRLETKDETRNPR